MARLAYGEGDWFAVPLQDGSFGVGLIARANPRGVLFGYFFGPSRLDLPRLADLRALTASDAVLVGKFGHLGLKEKRWPLLGRLDGWERDRWLMPVFIRREELTGRIVRVIYDENDPLLVRRVERLPLGEVAEGPQDGLMGAEFTEIRLSGLLKSTQVNAE
jgi:hypothetical protein